MQAKRWYLVLAASAAVAGAGCDEGALGGDAGGPDGGTLTPPEPDVGATGFVSADPTYAGDPLPRTDWYDGGTWADSAADVSSGADADADAATPEDPEDPARIVEEADIIRVEGDRLHALSRYRGLVVVDAANPDELSILGRYEVSGEPFEMYVRDGVVLAMYSRYVKPLYDAATGSWDNRTTSRVIALDVVEPSAIVELGGVDVPGEISDSRIVGDVLYVVSHESGYCWGCGSVPRTTVTSVRIADPVSMSVVDRVSYDEGWGTDWDGRRSVTVTTERMYVSSTGDGWTSRPTIQVVDISDPGGVMREGVEVATAGQVLSRWQMDEHAGVLRVVTQPGGWWDAPVVETFEVVSSDEIRPLGRLTLALPAPEDLMSVRFDGTTGYVVTYQRPTRTDPLFLIDLSDPAHPAQCGELHFPGWLHHLEPRGDRLFALGFEEGTTNALTVSLFDVADLDAPVMLDRVSFGGSSGSVPEDQDRIHKAFRILPDLGLILMPFAGWFRDAAGSGELYESGVQLIDFTPGDLALRGVAPHRGFARRAFVHRDRLFAVSDERVESFDFADRDRPTRTGSLLLARTVHAALPTGSLLAQLVGDWWTGEARLDLVSADDPDGEAPVGSVDLSELRPSSDPPTWYWSAVFRYDDVRLFAEGDRIHLVWPEASCARWYSPGVCWELLPGTGLAVVDVADPARPRLLGRTRVEVGVDRAPVYGGYLRTTVESGESVVGVGSAVVVRPTTSAYGYDEPTSIVRDLIVVGLADPEAVSRTRLRLAGPIAPRSLHVAGPLVYASHREPVPGDPSHAWFYLDRIDLSDPRRPDLGRPINVPGTVLHYDPETGRLLTLDYRWVRRSFTGYSCDGPTSQIYRYDAATEDCYRLEHSLNLLDVEDGRAVLRYRRRMTSERIGAALATPDRLFADVFGGYGVYAGRELRAFADAADRLPIVGRIPIGYSADLAAARDARAVVVDRSALGMTVWDVAAGPHLHVAPDLLPSPPVELRLSDDEILTTHGPWGVRRLALP